MGFIEILLWHFIVWFMTFYLLYKTIYIIVYDRLYMHIWQKTHYVWLDEILTYILAFENVDYIINGGNKGFVNAYDKKHTINDIPFTLS